MRLFEPCVPQPWSAEARKRAPQAASEIIHNAFSCKTFARAGCGGRAFSASRPRAQGLPYQKEPAGHACHNCHSERSGSTNAASAEAADGLCRARRRKTNEVQSNICIVSIQILRRSAPQNDKLLNCSQTPRQTGICNWRQRGKVKEKMFETAATCRAKHRLQPCEPKPRPAEARRIYKSPFLTGLAPLASAREHL